MHQNHLECEGSVERTLRNRDCKDSWRRLRPCPGARVRLGRHPALAQQSWDSPQPAASAMLWPQVLVENPK